MPHWTILSTFDHLYWILWHGLLKHFFVKFQLFFLYSKTLLLQQAIPFMYVLMSRKTEKCYTHLFQTLKEIFPLHGKSVMTDFELAMRNAIRNVYPTLKMYTCWFHFCQAVKRKASQLMHLMAQLKINENIKNAYYKLLCLPLLPASEILACFQMIKSQVADEKVFKPFLRYFETQWIKKVNFLGFFYPFWTEFLKMCVFL